MIQHGVSDHEDAAVHVGRVMDWLEARLDALKAREEEEDEDEDRAGPSNKPASTLVRSSSAPAPVPQPSRDSVSILVLVFIDQVLTKYRLVWLRLNYRNP